MHLLDMAAQEPGEFGREDFVFALEDTELTYGFASFDGQDAFGWPVVRVTLLARHGGGDAVS